MVIKKGYIVKEGRVYGKVFCVGVFGGHGVDDSVWAAWRYSVEEAKAVEYGDDEKVGSKGGRLTYSVVDYVEVVERG